MPGYKAVLYRFPKQDENDNNVPVPSMGVEGMDARYPRGRYPREAWPWNRTDAHGDAAMNWAMPAEWDGTSEYNGQGKLNTSIYELYVSGVAI